MKGGPEGKQDVVSPSDKGTKSFIVENAADWITLGYAIDKIFKFDIPRKQLLVLPRVFRNYR